MPRVLSKYAEAPPLPLRALLALAAAGVADDRLDEMRSAQARASIRAQLMEEAQYQKNRGIHAGLRRLVRAPIILSPDMPQADLFPPLGVPSITPNGPPALHGEQIPLGLDQGMVRLASARMQKAAGVLNSAARWVSGLIKPTAPKVPTFKPGVSAFRTPAPRGSTILPRTPGPLPKPPAPAPAVGRPAVAPTQIGTGTVQQQAAAPIRPNVPVSKPGGFGVLNPRPIQPAVPVTNKTPGFLDSVRRFSGQMTPMKAVGLAGLGALGYGAYKTVNHGLDVLGSESSPPIYGTNMGRAPTAVNQYGQPQFY